MKAVLIEYVATRAKALLLVCDDLQAYNLIIKGEEKELRLALQRSRVQGDNIVRMLIKLRKQLNLEDDVRIMVWKDIRSKSEYRRIYILVLRLYRHDLDFGVVVRRFVEYHSKRLGWQRSQAAIGMELRYLLEELSMSIFVTEFMGYQDELWERPPTSEDLDPLRYLYESKSGELRRLINKLVLERAQEYFSI